jgi:3'(2'), 5'-bisphosphate nucleotidase
VSDGGESDAALAARLAGEAGELLLDLRRDGLSGKELGAAGDQASHDLLVASLARHRPQDVVLSEEGPDHPERLGADRVWIVDPLDGTREYGEAGRSDWAVHVALVAGGDLATGAVALPARHLVLRSDAPPPLGAGSRPPRIVASRTRPPAFVSEVAARLGAEVVPLGSAGAKVAAVVLAEADCYLHAGGQYEWDSAAPVAVALAQGLHASRLDGSPLRYNRPDPRLPDLVVCRPELATRVLATVEEVTAP